MAETFRRPVCLQHATEHCQKAFGCSAEKGRASAKQPCTLIFFTCLMDMVQSMYRKMKEQSVKSSPIRFRCDKPCSHVIGSNGSLATTRPSNLKMSKIKKRGNAGEDFLIQRIKHAHQRHKSETDDHHRLHLYLQFHCLGLIETSIGPLTIDKSRLTLFKRSSAFSIFRFCPPCLLMSVTASFFFSTETNRR